MTDFFPMTNFVSWLKKMCVINLCLFYRLVLNDTKVKWCIPNYAVLISVYKNDHLCIIQIIILCQIWYQFFLLFDF